MNRDGLAACLQLSLTCVPMAAARLPHTPSQPASQPAAERLGPHGSASCHQPQPVLHADAQVSLNDQRPETWTRAPADTCPLLQLLIRYCQGGQLVDVLKRLPTRQFQWAVRRTLEASGSEKATERRNGGRLHLCLRTPLLQNAPNFRIFFAYT